MFVNRNDRQQDGGVCTADPKTSAKSRIATYSIANRTLRPPAPPVGAMFGASMVVTWLRTAGE